MRFVCPSCRGIISNDGLKSSEEFVQCGHCDEIVKIPSSRLSPGAVIGDFIIEREIGRGGMGVVFLSHQISLDRPAALKVLQDNFSRNAGFVVSFIREARAAAKLNHPHIVQAYAVGEDEGIFYFAMEFIEGETMKHVLAQEHKISCERALPIIQQVVEALDCAWKEAKLADLGLSQKAGEMDDADADEVMGTPQYISPEHLTGAPMDNRSDIYSLGATFYQFVTGEFPFKGNNPNEIARKHLEEPLTPPRQINPEIPQEVNDIIVRMMQKNPADRYQTNDELLDVLREARHHLP
ncbi:MAG: serine/threonine-protein kinase, partial [Victivallaceae bacterium]